MEQLEFNKTTKLLEKYKLPYAKSKLVNSLDKAVKAAKEISYPVVLKIISKDIIHKSDIKGIMFADDEDELISSFEKLEKIAKRKKAKLDGILIQKKESGKEVIVGMKHDSQFGPVILFGLGGVFVELMKDVSFRIAPIDKKEAEAMIDEIRSSEILKGFRGESPVKISALTDILVKVSNLSMKEKKILEIDFNPIIIDEKSAKIADARVMVE